MYGKFLTEVHLHGAKTCQGAHPDLFPAGQKLGLHDYQKE